VPSRCGESLERRPDAKPQETLRERVPALPSRGEMPGRYSGAFAYQCRKSAQLRATAKGAGGACRLVMTRVLESVRILFCRCAT
jgi:hypothetical protein